MLQPRFVVESSEDLIEAAQAADPPVRQGERAELRLPTRKVILESTVVDHMVVWEEIRA